MKLFWNYVNVNFKNFQSSVLSATKPVGFRRKTTMKKIVYIAAKREAEILFCYLLKI